VAPIGTSQRLVFYSLQLTAPTHQLLKNMSCNVVQTSDEATHKSVEFTRKSERARIACRLDVSTATLRWIGNIFIKANPTLRNARDVCFLGFAFAFTSVVGFIKQENVRLNIHVLVIRILCTSSGIRQRIGSVLLNPKGVCIREPSCCDL
jgi:hypothetical protein